MTLMNESYDARLNEIRRTLASGRKWHAMPGLLDELDRARRDGRASPETEREVWIGQFLAATSGVGRDAVSAEASYE